MYDYECHHDGDDDGDDKEDDVGDDDGLAQRLVVTYGAGGGIQRDTSCIAFLAWTRLIFDRVLSEL